MNYGGLSITPLLLFTHLLDMVEEYNPPLQRLSEPDSLKLPPVHSSLVAWCVTYVDSAFDFHRLLLSIGACMLMLPRKLLQLLADRVEWKEICTVFML